MSELSFSTHAVNMRAFSFRAMKKGNSPAVSGQEVISEQSLPLPYMWAFDVHFGKGALERAVNQVRHALFFFTKIGMFLFP